MADAVFAVDGHQGLGDVLEGAPFASAGVDDRRQQVLPLCFDTYGRLDTYDQISGSYHVPPTLASTLIPMVARTGRCFLPHDKEATDLIPLAWDDGDPWRFTLEMRETPQRSWLLTGGFRRGEQRMDLATPLLVAPGGFLFAPDHVAALAEDTALPWITSLRKGNSITVPFKDRDQFLAELLRSPILPALDLPAELHFEEVTLPLRPCLKISRREYRYDSGHMKAELSFDYDEESVAEDTPGQGFYQASARRFVRRDRAAEQAAAALLGELGLRSLSPSWQSEAVWNLPPPNCRAWFARWPQACPDSAVMCPVLFTILCPWSLGPKDEPRIRPGKHTVDVGGGQRLCY